MTTYYVDDGGSSTSPYDTWAKAAANFKALDAAIAFAAGDVVYIGHDSADSASHSANAVLAGPTSGVPMRIVSATQGSNPPTYQAATVAQINTSAGAYDVTFDGSFAIHGAWIYAGDDSITSADLNETILMVGTRLACGANSTVQLNHTTEGGYTEFRDLVIDLGADGTTNRTGGVITWDGHSSITGLGFVNAGYRTGTVLFENTSNPGVLKVSGADFSGFTNGTLCEIADTAQYGKLYVRNSATAATWAPFSSSRPNAGGEATFTNVGPAFAPTYLAYRSYVGDIVSTTSIYRSSGAEIEGTASAWLITTESVCTEDSPMFCPWYVGTVAAGSKTFAVYVTNDVGDFTDAEVWLEIEHLASASAKTTFVADKRASITTTAAAQTDDTTSTWNGSGPSFTYKQTLSVTATVGQAGQYRARVVVGKPSIASSAYFYVDPLVTVT